MTASRSFPIIALLCGLSLVAACNADQTPTVTSSPDGSASGSSSLLSNAIDHAMDRADEKLRTENITISDHDDTQTLPKAQITPQGDLLIADKAVPITPAQRSLLLEYRGQVVAIAMQGMAIGKQGAALGMKAAGEALAGVFAGNSDKQIQQHVQAQVSGIKRSAAKICSRLPELMASQQKLAAALPAFKPYATMTQKNIDDCRTDALKDDDDD